MVISPGNAASPENSDATFATVVAAFAARPWHAANDLLNVSAVVSAKRSRPVCVWTVLLGGCGREGVGCHHLPEGGREPGECVRSDIDGGFDFDSDGRASGDHGHEALRLVALLDGVSVQAVFSPRDCRPRDNSPSSTWPPKDTRTYLSHCRPPRAVGVPVIAIMILIAVTIR